MNCKRTLILCAGLSCANVLLLFSTLPVVADPPELYRYRILDLGDLVAIGEGDPGGSLAFGVNDSYQVTGMAQDQAEQWKAFIWLPENAYGLTGLNPVNDTRVWSLGTLLSSNSERSVGTSINNDGWITGGSQWDTQHGDINAFVWNPTEETYGSSALERKIDIFSLVDPDDYAQVLSIGMDISEAFTVEEDTFYHIAGISDGIVEEVNENCPEGPLTLNQGFHTTIAAATGDRGSLDLRRGTEEGDPRQLARAFAVNASGTLAGHIQSCADESAQCGLYMPDPVTWVPCDEEPEIQKDFVGEDDDWSAQDGHIFDINAAGEQVGRIDWTTQTGPGLCDRHWPAYWEGEGDIAIELLRFDDNDEEVDMTVLGINNAGQAVGALGAKNLDEIIGLPGIAPSVLGLDGAVLWERGQGDWDEAEPTDLDTEEMIGAVCAAELTLLAATDIADSGAIVGFGRR
jgi:hypothetical protein